MPKRQILVFHDDPRWIQFLFEAFEDTSSTPEIIRTSGEALTRVREGRPDIVFAREDRITRLIAPALRMHKTSNGSFRMFHLGASEGKKDPRVSGLFDEEFGDVPVPLDEFQKKLALHLPLPDPVRILVGDEDPKVAERFREFLGHRRGPGFLVEGERGAGEAVRRLERESPDVVILNPRLLGEKERELYLELKETGKLPPTIFFFDAFSPDEVLEIRRWGKGALVEKGSKSSALQEMTALIQKMAYFG